MKAILLLLTALVLVGCDRHHTYRITDDGQVTEVRAITYRVVDGVMAQRVGQYPAGFSRGCDVAVFECELPLGSDIRYYVLTSQWQIRELEEANP